MNGRTIRRFVGLFVCSLALAAFALVVTTTVLQRTNAVSAGLTLAIPADEPTRGLVFAGLATASSGPCQGGYLLPSSGLCTHGPDAAPAGVDIRSAQAPALVAAQAAATVACEGNGTSGNRTQVIYARPSNSPNGDRYAASLATIRQVVADVDTIYDASAAATGGSRRVRFVTDANCNLSVLNVVLSPSGDDNFNNTIAELQTKGYNSGDRKYIVFMDANVMCGISTFYSDSRPGSENYSNGGAAGYARVDTPCWEPNAVAHEHMHTLGGVQNSAPNASGGSHCVDEYDVMCYSDTPNYPKMQYLCPNSADNDRFDCGKNDYYNTNPAAGSYLATHWNTANNSFLIKSSTPNPAYTAPSSSPSTSPASPSPASPTSPSTTPQASPAATTMQLTVQATSGGTVSPVSGTTYAAGASVNVRATPNSGYIFTGWRIDGVDGGWVNPLTLTMDKNHTIAATFAARPAFADVPSSSPDYEAIGQLAARGIINGYGDGTFGPNDTTRRAQMAALIVRAMGWGGESASNPFPDQQGEAAELWRSVGILASRGVAKGYTDEKGGSYFDPFGEVSTAQTISFITRAMIAKGYWQAQPANASLYGGALKGTAHEGDVATFLHYTRALGGIPDYPESGSFSLTQPATRGWFAQTLWVALTSAKGVR